MTARRAVTADQPAEEPGESRNRDRGQAEPDPAITEVALMALTLIAVASLGRLFSNPAEFVVPVGITALAAHGLAAGLRRAQAPRVLVFAVLLVGGGAAVTLCLQATIAGAGDLIDTGAQISPRLSEAWSAFARAVPPTPVLGGYVAAGAGVFWLVAWAADTVALRVRAAVEATLPAAVVVVFGTVLADEVPAAWVGVATATTMAAVVLAERHRLGRASGAVTATDRAGHQTPPQPRRWGIPTRAGIGVLALAAGAASLAAPHLPGAEGEDRLGWRGIGDGPRTTISPLVDIRRRLVDQSDRVLFRVRTDEPSYWRLTALDRFDGQVWSASDRYHDAEGSLPDTADQPRAVTTTQRFELRALSTIWLPAAYRPVSVDAGAAPVRFAPDTGTLVVGPERPDAGGLTYRVRSQVPRLDPGALEEPAAGDGGVAPGPGLTALPADLDPVVARTATEVTESATDPFQAARQLQDWFRTRFAYDVTETPAGHSGAAITDFLAARRGYCEQFAGTYAAMARSLGLPARVAVGFTPGVENPADPGWLEVTGRQAHAWPEVHLGDAGWVAFEPTPGRGQPGAEAYTGVEPSQDTSTGTRPIPGAQGSAGDGGLPPLTPSTAPDERGPATTSPPIPSAPAAAPGAAPDPEQAPPNETGRDGGQLVLTVVIALAALATAAGVIARRRRAARAARSAPPAGIEGAFARAAAALDAHGHGRRPTETHLEYATRIETEVPAVAGALGSLARMASDAAWSPTPPEPEVEARAEGLAGDVQRALAAAATPA